MTASAEPSLAPANGGEELPGCEGLRSGVEDSVVESWKTGSANSNQAKLLMGATEPDAEKSNAGAGEPDLPIPGANESKPNHEELRSDGKLPSLASPRIGTVKNSPCSVDKVGPIKIVLQAEDKNPSLAEERSRGEEPKDANPEAETAKSDQAKLLADKLEPTTADWIAGKVLPTMKRPLAETVNPE